MDWGGIRTHDLMDANQTFVLLNYSPADARVDLGDNVPPANPVPWHVKKGAIQM